MKVIALAGLVLALSSPLAASAAKGAHDHSPRHGGIVTEAGNVDLELVLKADAITLHLRDHGKALKIEGGSAKLTLLSGANKQDVALAPAGEGRRGGGGGGGGVGGGGGGGGLGSPRGASGVWR